MLTVVIDPGHGGSDPGVVAPPMPPPPTTGDPMAWDKHHRVIQAWKPRLVEKTWVLEQAKKLEAALLELPDVDVKLTRQDDRDLHRAARGVFSEESGADLVLVLHVNSHHDSRVNGLMTFCWPGNAVGKAVGEAIAAAAPPELRRKITRCWEASDLPGDDDDWLRRARSVLAPHRATAVLVEAGHCTNAEDLEELLRPDVQRGIVAACVAGVVRFLAP